MLKRLSDIGYVDIQKDNTDKRLNVFKPLAIEEEKVEIHRISENPIVLKAKLEEGFETWKKNIGILPQFCYYKNFCENTWGESAITVEELEKIILRDERSSFNLHEDRIPTISKEDSKLKLEKKTEEIGKKEIQQFPANSVTNHQCSICKRVGKPMFFANEDDLNLHIQRLHIGYPSYAR